MEVSLAKRKPSWAALPWSKIQNSLKGVSLDNIAHLIVVARCSEWKAEMRGKLFFHTWWICKQQTKGFSSALRILHVLWHETMPFCESQQHKASPLKCFYHCSLSARLMLMEIFFLLFGFYMEHLWLLRALHSLLAFRFNFSHRVVVLFLKSAEIFTITNANVA